jgi:Zn-finger protein
MHSQARNHFYKICKEGKWVLLGANKECEYYPCHFMGQDCTWCFCPFYPCKDNKTGGEWVKTEKGVVWGCSNCYWIHKPEVAKEICEKFNTFGIDRVKILEKRKEEIKKVFLIVYKVYTTRTQ